MFAKRLGSLVRQVSFCFEDWRTKIWKSIPQVKNFYRPYAQSFQKFSTLSEGLKILEPILGNSAWYAIIVLNTATNRWPIFCWEYQFPGQRLSLIKMAIVVSVFSPWYNSWLLSRFVISSSSYLKASSGSSS